jgi:hypothetical protein
MQGGPLAYIFNAALRLAHNLLAYMNIDCNIVLDSEITADSENHFKDIFNRRRYCVRSAEPEQFCNSTLQRRAIPHTIPTRRGIHYPEARIRHRRHR